ncbi:MAG: hypothetical protein AAF810_20090 [Cyanobacteria bacterium P01_D01_bin.36]
MAQRTGIIEIDENGKHAMLPRVQLTERDKKVGYDEAFIENILFEHPEILPISEIDATYQNPVSVCTQLSTEAGILDVLYITPTGRLVILEAKLWRNPEAKRKVIAQLLDYAAALARWSYEDLERQVTRRVGEREGSLFRMVCSDQDDHAEANFVDEVSRSLRLGRFLLLICGDGIREGLSGIADFLENHTTLDFTFGLIEVGIFDGGGGRQIIYPRVLSRSVTLRRLVIRNEVTGTLIEDETDEDTSELPREYSDRERLLLSFWSDLNQYLRFDDPNQGLIKPTVKSSVTLRLPSPRAWITLYFEKKSSEQGLFLTFNRGEPGDSFWQRLQEEQKEIELELPPEAAWTSDGSKHCVLLTRPAPELSTSTGQDSAATWFVEHANIFVNAFRPRIERYLQEL